MLKLSSAAIGLIAALVLLTLLAGGRAGGYELLANGGFEDGVAGWSTTAGTLDSITDPVHGGARAARFTSAQQPSSQQVYQRPLVQAGQAYELSGWVLLPDSAIDRVFLRISWFDAGGSLVHSKDSPPLSPFGTSYRFLTTGSLTAPEAARSARVAAVVITTGASLLYLDDFSLQGPAPLPSATASPPPTASPTPSLTPAATASPGATPSATPTATPTASPTSTSTPTPTRTSTPTPTAVPTPAPALTQTARPTSTPPPPQEPAAFPALVNGGFEELREDGTPYGWRKVGGAITAAQTLHFEGQYSLALTSTTASTKWAYQIVAVQSGDYYEATAQALAGGPGGAVFLRISWYESNDGSGEAIDSADSTDVLQAGSPAFRLLTTGPVQAPAGARSARVRLMLRPASADQAAAYFDAVAFSRTEAPAPSAAPTATARPSPTPTPTVAAAATPAVTATPPSVATATPAPASAPTSAPSPWPDVFPALTNGGFEEARADGAPYGWRKAGGEMSVSDTRAEGALSLAFRSETAATKWAYQTVLAEGGAYYRASVQALKNDADAAAVFLRLSWYAGEDGSGEALASADSGLLETDAAAFRTLSVDARAPADARSVKVKLMLRPRSASPAVVFFDDASFVQIPAPPPAATPSPSPPTTQPPARTADQPDAAATSGDAPAAFASLINGGFEEWDGDGTARGWRHTGGEVTASERAAEGARALALTSRTGSTKWAYQALLVEPGAYYQASAQALAQDGATAFLRLSWYESEDGSGGALSSADSTQALGASAVYAGLATGPLQAPADARSVKLRLMLRPASAAVTTVYFDAVAFARAEPAGTGPVSTSSPAPVAAAPAALGRAATPALPANVKPPRLAESGSRSASGGGGGHGAQWVVILAVALPSAGLAAAAGYGIARRGLRQG